MHFVASGITKFAPVPAIGLFTPKSNVYRVKDQQNIEN